VVPKSPAIPEIESFNLADLNVSGLDARLELTTVIPQLIVCDNCTTNVECTYNTGCNCFSYN
jgi:hypothetical protein